MPATTSTPSAPNRARIRSRSANSRFETRLAQTREYFRAPAGQSGQILPPKADFAETPFRRALARATLKLGIEIKGVHRGVAELGGSDGEIRTRCQYPTGLRFARGRGPQLPQTKTRRRVPAVPSSTRDRARPRPALSAGDAAPTRLEQQRRPENHGLEVQFPGLRPILLADVLQRELATVVQTAPGNPS